MHLSYRTHIWCRAASLLFALAVAAAATAGDSIPLAARIKPLNDAVLVGQPVSFQDGDSLGKIKTMTWDFGDGERGQGRKITPVFNEKAYPSKSLYDLTTISTVLSDYLKRNWVVKVEPSRVLGPDHDYAWKKVDGPSSVHIIRDIDEKAMKKDFFDTLNGHPTTLLH